MVTRIMLLLMVESLFLLQLTVASSATSDNTHNNDSITDFKIMTPTKRFPCENNLQYDFLNIDRFTDNMCAQCVWYMAGHEAPWHHFESVNQWRVLYNYSDQINVLLCNPNCTEFKYETIKQANNSVFKELKSSFYMELLLDCCEQARQCCVDMLAKSNNNVGHDNDKNHCPAKWDGFMCWDSAKAGTINYKTCPSMTYFALGIKPTNCRNEMANKECWPNSTWARIEKWENNRTQRYWEEYTNYLPCSTPGATHKLRFIRVSIGFYVFSLMLTTIGFILLWLFPIKKSPKLCEIHKNFLLSLIFTSVFALLVAIFIKDKHYRLHSMIDKNPLWCRVLMIMMKSARLTNYCWMLNEAIVLWHVVVRPLPVNKINVIKFYWIGWIFPTLIMISYTLIRLLSHDHHNNYYNKSCWTKSMGRWELIYNIPTISFIIINFILLIYMMYVLFRKLSSSKYSYLRTSVGKSLVLVPVFGIHYAFYIVPFDPFESCATYLFVFQYVLIISEALQGAFVTIVFCFFNKEVRLGIKKFFSKKITKNTRNARNGTKLGRFSTLNENELQRLKSDSSI